MLKSHRQANALGRTEAHVTRDPFRFDGGPARMSRRKQPNVWRTSAIVVTLSVMVPFALAAGYLTFFS